MSIIKMPFIHRIRKSMGDNTYYRSRGQNVLRTKIDKNASNTTLQQMQRLKMKELTSLCKAFNSTIEVGFPGRPVTNTQWNAFCSANQNAVNVNEKLVVTVDYEKLVVAKGSREVVEDMTVMMNEADHELTFTHDVGDFGYGAEPTDVVYVAVLEKERMRSKLFRLNTRNDDSSTTVTLPTTWNMKQLAGYVFVLAENGKSASDSVYLPIPVS